MKLYEFEGKQLLKDAGIAVPEGYVIEKEADIRPITKETFLKAQTLSGRRGKAGFILGAKTTEDAKKKIRSLIAKTHNNEEIKKILIEEKIQKQHEFFLAITYDTKAKSPVIILSKFGGMDVEETKQKHPESVIIEKINLLKPLTEKKAKEITTKAGITNTEIPKIIKKCYDLFLEKDMKLLEINPLIQVAKSTMRTNDECENFVAADCKIILDDDALFRQNTPFPQRVGIGREKTQAEIAANKVNELDHRGIAGKTYIELDGDIGILASGGGASITAVDALISYNQKPANYTEYSGNPSPEKVEALTRIVMSNPKLKGLFVVGAKANFTQIHETIAAVIKVIKERKPEYPIVFRRAGPGDKEAKELVEQTAKDLQLDMEWYGDETPITVAAKRMAEKIMERKKCE